MSDGTNARIGKARRLVRVVNMQSAAPAIGTEKTSSEKWVKFGAHNLFPEFVRGLADNTPDLDACINTAALYIAGHGLEFLTDRGEVMEDVGAQWRSLLVEAGGEEMFLQSTALDIALMGTRCWIARGSAAAPIAALDHIDVCRIRASKKVNGAVPSYWFSSNWEKRTDSLYTPVEIPAFGQPSEDGRRALYWKSYKQLRDYYAEPHWLAALADAEVLARIPVFNRTQLDTGFRPAYHIHAFVLNKDDENIAELDEYVEEIFTGADGKNYVVTHGTPDEGAPQLTKLERGDHAGELDGTRKVSKEELFTCYGIPKALMGMDQATGLSGRGLALEQELQLFMSTKVLPWQKPITAGALQVMHALGRLDVASVRVKQLNPYDASSSPEHLSLTYLCRMTVLEDRRKHGMGPLTTDGQEPRADRSNWDTKNFLTLAEVRYGRVDGRANTAPGNTPAPDA